MKHVTLIGGVPSPIGGVTSYIFRLVKVFPELFSDLIDLYPHENKQLLPSSLGVRHTVYKGILSLNCYLKIFSINSGVIHFNFSTVKSFIFFVFLYKRKNVKWVLTLHNGQPDELIDKLPLGRFLFKVIVKLVLAKFETIASLSDAQTSFYRKFGVKEDMITKMGSFVPFKEKLSENLPEPYLEFKSQNHKIENKIILMNGYCKEIYNFEYGIEYINKNEDYLLVIVLYGDKDELYYQKLINLISDNKRVLILDSLEQVAFMTLLNDISIYLRANRVDSYGIAVADAVCLGKEVIASDICNRFPGCKIFPTGNKKEMFKLLSEYSGFNECLKFDKEAYINELNSEYIKLYE